MARDSDLTTSLCASPYLAMLHFSPAAAVTHCTFPVFDQTSAPEICALLRDLDSIQQLCGGTVSEMCSLKSTLSTEKKLREAAEATCADLEKEKRHLVESQLASVEQIIEQDYCSIGAINCPPFCQQLDYGTKYGNSMQSLEEMKNKLTSLAKVLEMQIASLNASHMITEDDLLKQIIDLKREAEAKERVTAGLEKQLSQSVTPDFFELKIHETKQQLHEKYLVDLADGKETFKSKKMKMQKLETDLKEAQQSLISWKVKYEDHLREMSSNRHADVLKQRGQRDAEAIITRPRKIPMTNSSESGFQIMK